MAKLFLRHYTKFTPNFVIHKTNISKNHNFLIVSS